MTEQEAQRLAKRIESEDHRVVATPQPKPAKSQKSCTYTNKLFYVHVLLKYGQRWETVSDYDGWHSIQQAWNEVAR